jgi:hypothetical protein
MQVLFMDSKFNNELIKDIKLKKNKAIQLHKYTAKDDYKPQINKVLDVGGYLGATNRHALIVDCTTKGKHYGFFDFYANLESERGEPTKLKAQLESIESNLDSYAWQDMPVISESDYKKCFNCNSDGLVRSLGGECEECEGSGEVCLETDFNDYDVECKSCDGEGRGFSGMELCDRCDGTKRHLDYVPMLMGSGNWSLNGRYVQKFSALPDVKVCWHDEYEFFALKFTGGFGIVMPMDNSPRLERTVQ